MVDTRSHRKRPTSIRTQITALLWIAVLPLAALHVRSTYETYELTLANSSALTQGLAEAAAAGTEQLLAMAEAQMLNAAQLHADELLDPERCTALNIVLLVDRAFRSKLRKESLMLDPDQVTLGAIEAAADRIAAYVHRTPLMRSRQLDARNGLLRAYLSE